MDAVFVELPPFERQRDEYMDDTTYSDFQQELMKNPEAGDVIQGTGGLRKVRFKDSSRGKGKRNGGEKKMKKRNLFDELVEGFDTLKKERDGKITLRRHKIEAKPVESISAVELVAIRESLKMSQAVFARHLRVPARTLENWEQGRAKPNKQATLLIKMVGKYPDTVERLEEV
jgi:putative transcriptional regulator